MSNFYYFTDKPNTQYPINGMRQLYSDTVPVDSLDAMSDNELLDYNLRRGVRPDDDTKISYLDTDDIWKVRDKTQEELNGSQ